MASFRKRNGRWQVQVRRSGHLPISKTFTARADAALWARVQEHTLETSDLPVRADRSTTVSDLLARYALEVVPRKRTDSTEAWMVRVLMRHPMARKLLSRLSAADVADFRDARLQEAKPATVLRQLRVLRHALRVARDEWNWRVPYEEVCKVRMPQVLVRHTERVRQESIELLLQESDKQANPHVSLAIKLALATGMRRGELLGLQWKDIDLAGRRALIRMSKNGRFRMVPLTSEACHLLRHGGEGAVVPISANSLKLGFARARRRAAVSFRFHDLRHEAISRFFERGLTIAEVQLISGHRTLSQLSRYTHPDVDRVAEKLAA